MKFAVLTHARGKFTPIWRPVGVAGVVQAVGIFAYQGSTAISSVLQGTAVSTKLRAHTEEYTPSSKQREPSCLTLDDAAASSLCTAECSIFLV